MEFSPCGRLEDEHCCELNRKLKEKKLQKEDISKGSPAYAEMEKAVKQAKADFKANKERLKESEYRIHPNICGYSHLDEVDSGAKQFDIDLNNAIAEIIILVDGYGKLNATSGT